jgi:hypothetical protein
VWEECRVFKSYCQWYRQLPLGFERMILVEVRNIPFFAQHNRAMVIDSNTNCFVLHVGKGKFSLEEAMKAQRGSRGIALLFL